MSDFRLSRYNHYLMRNNGKDCIVYNAASNGLAKLAPEEYTALRGGEQALGAMDQDTLDALRSGQIVVEKDLDELEIQRIKLTVARFNSSTLALTIVPTLGCNLGCTYCYEGLRTECCMDVETQDALVAFTGAQIAQFGYRGLSVSWFGGEPLLHPEILFSLSQKLIKLCRKLRVGYSAMVVTNGTCLNKTVARRLKANKVSHVQVTIDGPKEVHDVRRPFKEGAASSFDTITRNIDRVRELVPVQVRINVDKTNYHRCLEFIEQMRTRGWLDGKHRCSFYVGYTRAWTALCNDIADQCFTIEQFSEVELEFQKELLSRGFKPGNLYPTRSTYCTAAGPNGFVIGAGGELYKCWSHVNNPDECVGNVRQPLELKPKVMKWLTYDPLVQSPKCRACTFFPICAGGCPAVAIEQKENNSNYHMCSPWKILMNKKIDVYLEQLAQSKPPSHCEHCECTPAVYTT